MSLATRLADFITAVGADIKSLRQRHYYLSDYVAADGTVDAAPALRSLIATVKSNGGGVIECNGLYLINSTVYWPGGVRLKSDSYTAGTSYQRGFYAGSSFSGTNFMEFGGYDNYVDDVLLDGKTYVPGVTVKNHGPQSDFRKLRVLGGVSGGIYSTPAPAWVSSNPYKKYQVVTDSGGAWMALSDHSGRTTAPGSDGAYWSNTYDGAANRCNWKDIWVEGKTTTAHGAYFAGADNKIDNINVSIPDGSKGVALRLDLDNGLVDNYHAWGGAVCIMNGSWSSTFTNGYHDTAHDGPMLLLSSSDSTKTTVGMSSGANALVVPRSQGLNKFYNMEFFGGVDTTVPNQPCVRVDGIGASGSAVDLSGIVVTKNRGGSAQDIASFVTFRYNDTAQQSSVSEMTYGAGIVAPFATPAPGKSWACRAYNAPFDKDLGSEPVIVDAGSNAATARPVINGVVMWIVNAGITPTNAQSQDLIAERADAAVPHESSDAGFAAWTFDPALLSSNQQLVSGTMVLVALRARSTRTLASLTCYVATAGSGLTLTRMAIYDSTGALLGQSADQSSAFASIGTKVCPLTAGVPVTAGSLYYVALLQVGTTPSSPGRNVSSAIGNIGYSAAPYRFSQLASQSSVPATVTLGSLASNAYAWWMGMS